MTKAASDMWRVNVAGGATVASRCRLADGTVARLVGLLNRDSLSEDEALLLVPCNNVHTFFMRFAIDVVFLDKDNRVVAVREMRPWRVSPLVWSARKVLEMPMGRARAVGLKTGDKLEVIPCSN